VSVIVLLIAAGGVVAGGFLIAFLWAVGSGQYDDTTTPPVRMLFDDTEHPQPPRLSKDDA
jgi:cbb3-type cytochrome oxidase maturation protein